MKLDVRPRRLPTRTFVPLAEALTWLAFDSPMSVPELLKTVPRAKRRDDVLRATLTQEWQDLTDYACGHDLAIRAIGHGRVDERKLTLNQLRRCTHVGWREGESNVRIDPFPYDFSGGFQSQRHPRLTGFYQPTVQRAALVIYKRVRPRRQSKAVDREKAWEPARSWLTLLLRRVEKIPGLKTAAVQYMVDHFGITRSTAQSIWTEVATTLEWPLKGAPSNDQKKKLRSILNDPGVFR